MRKFAFTLTLAGALVAAFGAASALYAEQSQTPMPAMAGQTTASGGGQSAGHEMMCPMMRSGMMQGGMMDREMMNSGSNGGGMGALFGSRVTPLMNLSVDDVRGYLTARLDRLNNKRLKVGGIKSDDGAITADIVTADNSLVQRMKVDRHTGAITYEN